MGKGMEKALLVLSSFGCFLGRVGNCFYFRTSDGKRTEISALNVDSILICNPGTIISASALRLALLRGIGVLFTSRTGTPHGFLHPTLVSGSVVARRKQYQAYWQAKGFEFARAVVYQKLRNQARLLRLYSRNRKVTMASASKLLASNSMGIENHATALLAVVAHTVDAGRQTILQFEGRAAKLYWSGISAIMPAYLNFEKRHGRGATDPVNAMLNFGYMGVLFRYVWKSILIAGLDPYAGFLHADRPNKPSLVLDMMEEFRQDAVDRIVVGLFTRRKLGPSVEMMRRTGEGVRLSPRVLGVLCDSLVKRTRSTIGNTGTTLELTIGRQARRLSDFLLDREARYVPHSLMW
jgi:CRISPR-associated protein Cas1